MLQYIMGPASDTNGDGLISKSEFNKMMMFLKIVLVQVQSTLRFPRFPWILGWHARARMSFVWDSLMVSFAYVRFCVSCADQKDDVPAAVRAGRPLLCRVCVCGTAAGTPPCT